MEWSFVMGNKKYYASYTDGQFLSDSTLLSRVIDEMIKQKSPVRAGYMAAYEPASLAAEAVAWGTITSAIYLIATDAKIDIPTIDVGLEPM